MTIDIGLPEVSVGVLLLAALQYFGSLWISEKLKTSLQKEHSQFLEDLKWELKVREQAVRVAEYLSLATTLKGNSPDSDYRKANQLNWELAMWLPEEIYKKLACATTSSTIENSVVTVLSVRAALLKEKAGTLTKQDITYHAPGIGRNC